jgi:hypothetical protein
MKDSIADFGRDVRREVEGVSSRTRELEREMERWKAEAEAQRLEKEKQVRRGPQRKACGECCCADAKKIII